MQNVPSPELRRTAPRPVRSDRDSETRLTDDALRDLIVAASARGADRDEMLRVLVDHQMRAEYGDDVPAEAIDGVVESFRRAPQLMRTFERLCDAAMKMK